ncbi:hypothetical protein SLS58_001159 [Diplodia intermedia]|uniref:Uncharacterized protein n=1 Tax=Diplodia intermedia TaxID=856260 RepID=A0ABR3U344_9PEZI
MSSATPATADSTPPPTTTLLPPLNKATTGSSSKATSSVTCPLEPSRFIHVSGIRAPRPLAELRHWFSRGHFIYDELREPVVPTAVAGAGPDRLATATSGAHPRWESTLGVPALRSAPAADDVEVEGEGEGDAGAPAEAPSGAPASASVPGLDGCDAASAAAVAEKRGLDASAAVPGGDGVLREKAKATEAEFLFEAQVKTIEDVEAALALQHGEGAIAAEEEQRLIAEKDRKAEIKSKTWTGSRGKYGHKKGARPHAFHGRPAGGFGVDSGRYQQEQQQQDGRYGMNSYDEAAHARYTGQFDHFDPRPTPGTLSRYESCMGPDDQLPESLSTHYWRMREEYEAKVEAAQLEQHRLRRERLAKYPETWRRTVRDTTPVVSPVMSVLSPRAHEFVPAGLISPPASHSFVTPSMGATGVHHRHSSQAEQNVVWYPAPPAPVGSTQYWLNRQYGTMSTLNPTAGEFRPYAMPPRGPKMDDGGAGI